MRAGTFECSVGYLLEAYTRRQRSVVAILFVSQPQKALSLVRKGSTTFLLCKLCLRIFYYSTPQIQRGYLQEVSNVAVSNSAQSCI